jgi:hypothetical protein
MHLQSQQNGDWLGSTWRNAHPSASAAAIKNSTMNVLMLTPDLQLSYGTAICIIDVFM